MSGRLEPGVEAFVFTFGSSTQGAYPQLVTRWGSQPRPGLLGRRSECEALDRASAQVLSFVARRLQAESVLVLFAERDDDQPDELKGLPELRLHRLSYADARELFSSLNVGPQDEQVRDRIIAETRGNPL